MCRTTEARNKSSSLIRRGTSRKSSSRDPCSLLSPSLGAQNWENVKIPGTFLQSWSDMLETVELHLLKIKRMRRIY